MTQFGKFRDFCRDSTLPICPLLNATEKSCKLEGIEGRVSNLGSILFAVLAVIVAAGLIWRSDRKKAAVGRREIQIFLVFYIILSIAEVFSIGGFLKDRTVLVWFSSVHIGAIAATCWVLLLNAIVGFQLLDDGTPLSIGLTIFSGLAFFVGVGYIALDTGFTSPTGYFTVDPKTLKHVSLYILYLLVPLICIVLFYILESFLVLSILHETRPMILLTLSGLLFVIAQIFSFVASVHICDGTSGRIDGSMFQTLFTLLAVIMLWFFWSSITEDEWPEDTGYPLVPNQEDGYTVDDRRA
ncbi:hypothetical protein EX30DRAFT_98383 [Ascodesmis nigricans]|uniref:Uncharacterized protein n=1 Tax=Ascodesmis nigricans TaxID=341454 RepID=A0A4S2N4X0_9PEZI|nr:hypothetical protein EX30DRAFT_98383 [Ascodesmis nigricans]